MPTFEENEHPRDENGKFASENGIKEHSEYSKLQEKHKDVLDQIKKTGDKGHVIGEHSPTETDTKKPIVAYHGNDTYGLVHANKHINRFKRRNFPSALSYLWNVGQNYNDYRNDKKHGSRVIFIKPKGNPSNSTNVNMAALELRDKGTHYSVKTAYPGKWGEIEKMEKVAKDGLSEHSSPFSSFAGHKGTDQTVLAPISTITFRDEDGRIFNHFLRDSISLEKDSNQDMEDQSENISKRKVAGIIYSAQGKYLLLKRLDGNWGIVAGKEEDGDKTPFRAAQREAIEEIGIENAFKGEEKWRLDLEIEDGTPFTVFGRECEAPFQIVFTPAMKEEHSAYLWATKENLPSPLMPNTPSLIERFGMTYGQMLNAIQTGKYPSPQPFQNVWIFNLRITGTGWAVREGQGEDGQAQFTHRPPEEWLKEDNFSQLNGMPITWDHPDSDIVNEDFLLDRQIGSVVRAYRKDNDIWAICRIQDSDAAKQMKGALLSTSPGMITSGMESTGDHGESEYTENLLVFPDHLAVVPGPISLGVWDKHGPPQGVDNAALRKSQNTDQEAA